MCVSEETGKIRGVRVRVEDKGMRTSGDQVYSNCFLGGRGMGEEDRKGKKVVAQRTVNDKVQQLVMRSLESVRIPSEEHRRHSMQNIEINIEVRSDAGTCTVRTFLRVIVLLSWLNTTTTHTGDEHE